MSVDQQSLVLEQLANASRHVSVLSPDLKLPILNSPSVINELAILARRGRQSRIRLLVSQFHPAHMNNHSLVQLARRLTSCMALKVLPEHPQWRGETVILCDRSSALIWRDPTSSAATLAPRPVAAHWHETIEQLWTAADDSLEMRRL